MHASARERTVECRSPWAVAGRAVARLLFGASLIDVPAFVGAAAALMVERLR